jgi:hypothetical protein
LDSLDEAPIKYPFHDEETDIKHRVLVSIPFSYEYSKNKIEGRTKYGKTYPNKDHWELRDYLTRVLTEACAGIEWKKQKYYVSYYCQKPSYRGDAINFLEAFADVIKKVIGVDDNYLVVEDIDFEVIKNGADNRIFISISQ